jgi:hypothetical protein
MQRGLPPLRHLPWLPLRRVTTVCLSGYGTTDRPATDGGSAGATPRSVREVAGSLAASTASCILCSLIPSQDLILTVAKALWELRA